MMNALWRIELLGGLRIVREERVTWRFRTQKTGALLAYLACYLNRTHTREALIERLWPEIDLRTGRHNLRQSLCSLRRQLEPPGVAHGAVIFADRNTVQLNPAACVTDVDEFETACRGGLASPAGGDRKAVPWRARRAQHLAAAVALYRGELLPGCLEEWILPERQRLAELFQQALSQFVLHLEQAGDLPRALQYARRAVAADPLGEEAHVQLIRLLAAVGRPDVALQQYEELERRLSQFGAVPSAETRALAAAIEQNGARSHGQPIPVEEVSSGSQERQAREVRIRVRRRSAQSAPGRQGIPAPQPAVIPGSLPPQFDRFFGRESEISLLNELLGAEATAFRSSARGDSDTAGASARSSGPTAEAPRLVTLTGPGGSGKTRLAIEASGRLSASYPGGVWFVPLADLTDPRLILEKVVEALHLPRTPGVEPLDQLLPALSRQPILLLLDNFEHLLDEGAAVVRDLLQRVATLTLLITSRQRLGLPGEREFPVAPLEVPGVEGRMAGVGSEPVMPDTRHPTPDALLQVPSVALFVDRAQAVVPDFQVTKRNAEAVAALCRRLEGLPLAIELAAARVGVVTPAQMLQRLPDAHVGAHEGGGRGRFELLRSRQRPADVRHQSLWMALDWSFQLLLPEVQRCFARLSVFQGGFTLAAATAVCGEPGYPRSGWTLDFLQLLRECSLIQGEGGEPEIRFRLLETLREFGAEQLSEQERQDLARQHARYYLELSEEATPKLRCAEQAEWQARLEREHDNLRAALQWSVDRGPIDLVLPATGEAQALSARPDSSRRDTGLRLSGALAWFWHLRGHWGEGRRWLELALAPSLGGGVPPADRGLVATALHGAGLLAFDQCDYEAARTCCEQSSAIWRERHDPWHLAASLIILAEVASARGDYATARPHAEEGLLISRRLGDPWALASALSARAGLAWEEGDYPAARAFGVESVAVWRQLRMPSGAAAALARLGDVAGVEGDHLRGRAAYEESLALSRETGDQHGIADALRRLGCAAIGQEASEAPALIQEALAMFRDLGDRFCTAASLYDLARAVRAQGDWEATRAYFAESLVVRKEAGIPLGAAASLEGLATVARARNQPEQALRWLGAAQALRRAIGARSSSGFQRWVDGQLAALRDALGEGAFTASWEAGQALTLEQAAAEALSDAW